MTRTSSVVLAFAVALGCFEPAAAQSFYVDFDIGIDDPAIGGGAPSSAFGGAAEVPGVWNRVIRDDGGPIPLIDTSGSPSRVVLTWTGGAGRLGFRNTSNTRDFALLLNDGEEVGGTLAITLTGLEPGDYRVFTYAVPPQGYVWTTDITIPGSTTPNPQPVTGPMPGNQLIQGITHSAHSLSLDAGPLVIEASGDWPGSYVNGFQVLAVPEPTTVSALAIGVAAIAAARRTR